MDFPCAFIGFLGAPNIKARLLTFFGALREYRVRPKFCLDVLDPLLLLEDSAAGGGVA